MTTPFMDVKSERDDETGEYFAVDDNGVRHYDTVNYMAELKTIDANAVIEKHAAKNPDERIAQLTRERDKARAERDKARAERDKARQAAIDASIRIVTLTNDRGAAQRDASNIARLLAEVVSEKDQARAACDSLSATVSEIAAERDKFIRLSEMWSRKAGKKGGQINDADDEAAMLNVMRDAKPIEY